MDTTITFIEICRKINFTEFQKVNLIKQISFQLREMTKNGKSCLGAYMHLNNKRHNHRLHSIARKLAQRKRHKRKRKTV